MDKTLLKINDYVQAISFFSGIFLIFFNIYLFFKSSLLKILLSVIAPLFTGITNYNNLGTNSEIFITIFQLTATIHAIFLIIAVVLFFITFDEKKKNDLTTIFGYINIAWLLCNLIIGIIILIIIIFAAVNNKTKG
jgi:hypothetical protein